MLKREKQKVKSKKKKKSFEIKIYETEESLIKTKRKLKSDKERKAIEEMKKPRRYSILYTTKEKIEKMK